MRKLGADYALDYTKYDICQKVMKKMCNLGVNYIVNIIDSESAIRDTEILAFNGEFH